LLNVGDVVGLIGDEVSETGRTARLTKTYTGNPTTIATAIIADSSPIMRHR
jgi:hypothetical protein